MTSPDAAAGALLVHNVYFSLHDRTSEARTRLIEACRRWLPRHDGIVFFAVGVLADELRREVNDRDFDVGLHVIFRDQAAHDAYQISDDHQSFIAENKSGWKRVRVFDSLARPDR